MKTPYLQIQGLKKSYTLKPILRGIDLDLYRGERVALLGANGTGKTTLLRILAGLTKPSAGTICNGGLDIVHDAQRVRHLVGFVAHQPYLYDELTAMENLLFFGRMYAVKQVHERAAELLNRVGLARRAQERVSTLSRGQVQRLSLARALLHSPQLLLLDEPDTGLDEEGNELLADILYEHTEKDGTTLFTTHNLEHALSWSNQIAILHAGRVIYTRKTEELKLRDLQEVYHEVINSKKKIPKVADVL
jgi:heme ABC exporter ATP-binding subunit CcmA